MNPTSYQRGFAVNEARSVLPVPAMPTAAQRQAVARQIARFGFAVVGTDPALDAPSALAALARAFDLGDPYVPELYRRHGNGHPLADIKRDAGGTHPGFASDTAQCMHVDGLLEPIGAIRTSLLYCVRPAAEGGRTILFDACAVLERLADSNLEAAEALLADNVLERFATLPGADEAALGPAFRRGNDGRLISRFSDGPTERWIPLAGQEVTLESGLAAMRAAAAHDGPDRISIGLREHEVLILANDRLSHGREAFRSDPQRPRHLVRALHANAIPMA
jgi:alpha-ketoglutarate-dependent taurine dioxygenase